MRGLRRISGDVRCSSDTTKTDLDVRKGLGVDSIDALLMVARLQYFATVVRKSPATLTSLLHFRRERDGAAVPWMELIRRDAHFLRCMQWLPDRFPGLDEAPGQWSNLLKDDAA